MDKVTNKEVWRRAGQRPAEEEIGKRRMRWVGHTLRKENNSIPKKALDWNPQGKRKRGRPRHTWRPILEGDVKRSGKSWGRLRRLPKRERNGGVLLVAYILIQDWKGNDDDHMEVKDFLFFV